MQKIMTWSQTHLFFSGSTQTKGFYGATMEALYQERSREFFTEHLCRLSPDGTLVAICEPDGVIRVRHVVATEWRVGDVLLACPDISSFSVRDLVWSPTSHTLAILQQSGSISLYQIGRRRAPLHTLSRLAPIVEDHPVLVFAPRGERIAHATSFGVSLWEAKSGRLFREISGRVVTSLAWSPDERYIALGYPNAVISVRLARTGRLVCEWSLEEAVLIRTLAWSPDGRFLLAGTSRGARLWECSVDPTRWPLDFGTISSESVEALAWAPQSTRFALLNEHDQLDVYSLPL